MPIIGLYTKKNLFYTNIIFFKPYSFIYIYTYRSIYFFRNHSNTTKSIMEKIQEQTEIIEVIVYFSQIFISRLFLISQICVYRNKQLYYTVHVNLKNQSNTFVLRSLI